MRKFLLSMVLVLLSGVAIAQTVVTAINTENYYTLECRSGYAHSTARFIGDNGTVINGQSATAAFFQFEAAETENGYYIKSVKSGKYINHNGTNISASTERTTVWTFGVGGKDNVANVVTFTIGNDKYLNNNGSDCADGTVQNLKANTHSGGPASGNACSLWEMCEYTEVPVSVTYRYMLNGVEKKTVTVEQGIGTAYEAPAVPYVTFEYPEGNITAETTTVDVTCTQNLPFALSESYTDAKWYYMTIRSNGQKYVSRSENTPYNNSTTIPYGANGRWAFTGNAFDGIKVLNNGAGEGYTLGYDNTATASDIYMKEGETSWIIEEGNGGFLLRQSGANEYAHDYSSKLQFWNNSGAATDAGSAFIAYEAETIEATFDVTSWKESELNYLGYVGGYTEELRDEIEAIEDFAGYENFVTNNTIISVNTNSYYRIVCAHPKDNGGDASYNTLTFNGNANLVTAPTSASNINQIFKFEDAGNGKFYLKNMNADGYLNKISAGSYRSAITTKEEACKLELSIYGSAQWKLKNSEGDAVHCLFAENHPTESVPYACAGWEAGAGSASAWYIIPAKDVEVTVNEYATVYLPFAVSVENATANAVAVGDGDYVTLAEKADIPANEGAVLAGNGTAKLNIISAATSDWSENMLDGTTISRDVTPEGTGYVLSKVSGEIGFYRAITEGKAEGTFLNNANKAYLVVPAGQAEGIAAYSFRFEGGTTGIDNVAVENGVQTIFDLTGRRIENITAPGIYIVNGKKVLVK